MADGTVKGAPSSADTVRIDITTLLRSPASIQRRPAAGAAVPGVAGVRVWQITS